MECKECFVLPDVARRKKLSAPQVWKALNLFPQGKSRPAFQLFEGRLELLCFQPTTGKEVIEGLLKIRHIRSKPDCLLIGCRRVDEQLIVFKKARQKQIIERGLFAGLRRDVRQ